ncbi:helix-turn-helix domain-containing protein [Nonomuraea sp. NPDC049646]|uniref:helix-turn-helix domain-containing protein n=1 Tax=unclassified Nonomuraea TaxID=2593643 RepID=UPI0037905A17
MAVPPVPSDRRRPGATPVAAVDGLGAGGAAWESRNAAFSRLQGFQAAGVGLALPNGWVVLSPPAARHCRSALTVAVQANRRDGIGLPAEVRELIKLLVVAVEASALPETEVPKRGIRALSGRWEVGPAADSRESGLGPRPPADVGTAAAHLGITPRGVRDLCSRGALPAAKFSGRWFIDWVDLEEFAHLRASREAGVPSDPGIRTERQRESA